ncbi:RNA polymerase subunit sigma-24 [Tetzosporium hominis]|uniref:RNA polymerase subunit sigma-24 n=1 Tax=Tetzosporium hominis TaxID=2020506 RepID=A0A264W4Z7_9BACL|nr:sigma-70 family RNA polymerase sigma factor [Tetzosporium hominis]OZS78663.1 RNA polymerase subunit sigma-24 [Tetzosporium hominis]
MNTQTDLEQTIRQHGEELLRLAYTYVKNRQTAEDLVQDVFLKAFVKQTDFRGDSHYKTYLYRMVMNRCKDYLRSWHYRKTILMEPFQGASSGRPSRELSEDNAILGNQVLALPIKYREVLVFYYYKELSMREIAELLNVSENTVKTRMQRGRKQLKLNLERGGYDARFFYQNEY